MRMELTTDPSRQKLCHEVRDLKSALAQKTLEHNDEIDRRRNLESQAQDAASALKLSQQSMVRPRPSPALSRDS